MGQGGGCDGVLADTGMGMGNGYMGVFGVAMWGIVGVFEVCGLGMLDWCTGPQVGNE